MVHRRQRWKNFICHLRFIRRRGTSRNNKWAGNIPNGKMIPLQGNKNIKYTKDKEKTKVFLPRNLKNEPIVLRFKVKK